MVGVFLLVSRQRHPRKGTLEEKNKKHEKETKDEPFIQGDLLPLA